MKIIIIMLLVAVVDFLFYCFYYLKNYTVSPLDIRTFDGSDEPFHPSIVYKEKCWNGYRFWMVITPYPICKPPYRDRWECPCIYCSNDGINWKIPKGIINPLDDLTLAEIENRDYFSDPHLVFNNEVLECWYRISRHKSGTIDTYLLRKTSKDGIHWTKREIMADPNDKKILETLGNMVRSQALLYHDQYGMWYIDNKSNKGKHNLCFSQSLDGKKWTVKTICFLQGKNLDPWHIDVNRIDNRYYLLIYDLNNLSLWDSLDGIHFTYIKQILAPSHEYGNFYSEGLYRSVLVKVKEEYYCYFSAFDENHTWIGLMKGKDYCHLEVENVRKRNFLNLILLRAYFIKRKKILSWVKLFLFSMIKK